jgi:hypothetical protein
MDMRTYFIRAAKYMLYLLLIFTLIYVLMRAFDILPPSIIHFMNLRLAVALVLVGLIYPFLGYKRIAIDLPSGGRAAHEAGICEAVERCGFRVERRDENTITFTAISPLRRIMAMYEERITLTFHNSTNVTVEGLRKDIARVRLCIGDYCRTAK